MPLGERTSPQGLNAANGVPHPKVPPVAGTCRREGSDRRYRERVTRTMKHRTIRQCCSAAALSNGPAWAWLIQMPMIEVRLRPGP